MDRYRYYQSTLSVMLATDSIDLSVKKFSFLTDSIDHRSKKKFSINIKSNHRLKIFFSSKDHRSNRCFLQLIDYRYRSNQCFFRHRCPSMLGEGGGCLGFCTIDQTENTGYTGYLHEKDTGSNRHAMINRWHIIIQELQEKTRLCGEPAISHDSHHVSLVQWTTCLLPATRDSGSNPLGGLMWNRDSPVSGVSLQLLKMPGIQEAGKGITEPVNRVTAEHSTYE